MSLHYKYVSVLLVTSNGETHPVRVFQEAKDAQAACDRQNEFCGKKGLHYLVEQAFAPSTDGTPA